MNKLLLLCLLPLTLMGCETENQFGESYPDVFEPRDLVFLHCLRGQSTGFYSDTDRGIIFDRANDALYPFIMGPYSFERDDLKPTDSLEVTMARRSLEAPVEKNKDASRWRYGQSDADDPNVWRTKNFSSLKSVYDSDIGGAYVIHRAALWVKYYLDRTTVRSHKCVVVPSWEELEKKALEMDRRWNKHVEAKKARIEKKKREAEQRNKI